MMQRINANRTCQNTVISPYPDRTCQNAAVSPCPDRTANARTCPVTNRTGMSQGRLMRKIWETDFAIAEVTLFLNTHPGCKKALRYFCTLQSESLALREEYQRRFGPVTSAESNCENGWQWTKTPWPWQHSFYNMNAADMTACDKAAVNMTACDMAACDRRRTDCTGRGNY